jgi:hypothetical protein
MSLDVWPQRDPRVRKCLGHAPSVALDDIEVDDERGRVEVGRQ